MSSTLKVTLNADGTVKLNAKNMIGEEADLLADLEELAKEIPKRSVYSFIQHAALLLFFRSVESHEKLLVQVEVAGQSVFDDPAVVDLAPLYVTAERARDLISDRGSGLPICEGCRVNLERFDEAEGRRRSSSEDDDDPVPSLPRPRLRPQPSPNLVSSVVSRVDEDTRQETKDLDYLRSGDQGGRHEP